MPKAEYINPPGLEQVSGYRKVVKVGNVVYVSGQCAIDAQGNTVGKGDPEAQVRQVWRNIEIALKSVGGSLRNVVSTTTYLTSNDYRWAMNKVREELFPSTAPTSTGVVLTALAKEEWLVEIQAIAHLDI